MLELDTRQIATLIWFITIILALSLWHQTRRAAWPAFKEVVRTAATWKVIVPIAAYFTYATLATVTLNSVGIWQNFPLIEALIVIFFVGLPMFFNANNEKSGEQLFKKTESVV